MLHPHSARHLLPAALPAAVARCLARHPRAGHERHETRGHRHGEDGTEKQALGGGGARPATQDQPRRMKAGGWVNGNSPGKKSSHTPAPVVRNGSCSIPSKPTFHSRCRLHLTQRRRFDRSRLSQLGPQSWSDPNGVSLKNLLEKEKLAGIVGVSTGAD